MASLEELKTLLDHVSTDLRAAADAEKAPQMAAYMKDRFEFLGLTSPIRKRLQRPFINGSKGAEPDDVLTIAEILWDADAREMQYLACDLLRARAQTLGPEHLDRVRYLVETKSWWDTIDALAAHTLGTMVAQHPELGDVMDVWIHDRDMWVARVAILHQLTYKTEVDEARLFSYVITRASDTEFFIRKALGWALRSYARVAPDRVRVFVAANATQLSGLTKREATKHL